MASWFVRLTAVFGAGLVLAGCSAASAKPIAVRATTVAQAEANYVKCMRAKGWDVQASGSGGDSYSGPTSQVSAYEKDSAQCDRETELPTNLTTSQWTAVYQKQVKVSQCLAGLGFQTTPPSLQTYLDQPDAQKWTPYVEAIQAGSMSTAQLATAQKTCPQVQ